MKNQPLSHSDWASKKSVFGVASSRIEAYRIVDHLLNAGFDLDDISVLLPDGNNEGSLAGEKAKPSCCGGTATGIGPAAGGALRWLPGMGAFSVPDFGVLMAGGPLGAVPTGTSASRAAHCGFKSTLTGMGIHDGDASLYHSRVKEGRILICLHTREWRDADAARKIFQAMSATNITITGEKASGMLTRSFSGAAKPAVEVPEEWLAATP